MGCGYILFREESQNKGEESVIILQTGSSFGY